MDSAEFQFDFVLRLLPGAFPCMTPLERALDLSYAAFAILHQHGRFSGPQHQRVCEAILGDLRIARRQGVRGVVLEIFSRDQQVMGLLLPDAGPPELLGFDDRTMMYEGDAKDWEAKVHWHGNPEAPAVKREDGRGLGGDAGWRTLTLSAPAEKPA